MISNADNRPCDTRGMRFSRVHAIASMLLTCCPALISCGSDWYAARKGQVIIEVRDEYSELSNTGAKNILAIALKRLP